MTGLTKLLVTGERRSGTTLLANLLNAGHHITVYRDFLHIARLQRFVRAGSLIEPLTAKQKQALVAHFNSQEITRKAKLNIDCKTIGVETLIDFYALVLQQIAKPEDIVVGHKTTCAHVVVGELLAHVPELKVIYIIRDPRDVTISAVRRFPHESWTDHVASWRRSYETMARHMARPEYAPRILSVQFRDLLLYRAQTLDTIATFLGIDEIRVPETMTDYGQQWQDNSSFGDLGDVLDTTPLGRWQRQDPGTGRRVEILLHDVMADAGYEISARITRGDMLQTEARYWLDRLLQKPARLFRKARKKISGPNV